MSKTREQRRRSRKIMENVISFIVFFGCLAIACGLPDWLTWAGL